MNMRWWSFNRILICIAFAFNGQMAKAITLQDTRSTDTLQTAILTTKEDTTQEKTSFMYRYDRRLERYKKHFNSLIPQQNILQLYGDMGLVSIGCGWDYGKREQWETHALLGFIPKYNSDKMHVSLTLKQTYIPWSFFLNDHFSIEPLTTGMYLNTVFGSQFWTSEPERYPKGYYGFSTRVRIHIFAGQSVTLSIPHDKRFFAQSVSLFYEISSCDLYIVSAFTNHYLKPKDYLRFSVGLKFKIL